MFESSTTQPTKFIWPAASALAAEKTLLLQCLKAPLRNLPSFFQPAARALAAEKTWLLQCLKALLRNLPRLFGEEGGLFQLKSIIEIPYYSLCL